jgi:pimeloyl-ACP methyl ester carboxylesterase
VIVIDGAFGHRSFGPNKNLPALLADRFTVIADDRRGKGESGDTPPWTVEREIEDLCCCDVDVVVLASSTG